MVHNKEPGACPQTEPFSFRREARLRQPFHARKDGAVLLPGVLKRGRFLPLSHQASAGAGHRPCCPGRWNTAGAGSAAQVMMTNTVRCRGSRRVRERFRYKRYSTFHTPSPSPSSSSLISSKSFRNTWARIPTARAASAFSGLSSMNRHSSGFSW